MHQLERIQNRLTPYEIRHVLDAANREEIHGAAGARRQFVFHVDQFEQA
jgi:hypothetical protein